MNMCVFAYMPAKPLCMIQSAQWHNVWSPYRHKCQAANKGLSWWAYILDQRREKKLRFFFELLRLSLCPPTHIPTNWKLDEEFKCFIATFNCTKYLQDVPRKCESFYGFISLLHKSEWACNNSGQIYIDTVIVWNSWCIINALTHFQHNVFLHINGHWDFPLISIFRNS